MGTWSPDDLKRIRRRTLLALAFASGLSSIGLFASVAISSILARRLFSTDAWAGAPVAFYSIGIAGITIPLSALMSRVGRRRGLVFGYALGSAGAALAIAGTSLDNVPILLTGMILLGMMYGTSILGRFAAADVASPEGRGRAISSITWSLVIGALLGPNMLEVSGKWSTAAGLPKLTGPFLMSLVGGLMSAVVLHIFLRPDPMEVAGAITGNPDGEAGLRPRPRLALLALADVRLSMVSVAVVQFVMVSVMAISGAHVDAHHGSLALAGFVLSAHFVGMYGLAPAAGWVADRLGPHSGLLIGQSLVGSGGALAWLSPFQPVFLSLALFLIGLGWNFNLVGASALVTGSVNPLERTRVQGLVDFLSGGMSVAGGLAAGVMLVGLGFSGMGTAGVVLMAATLTMLLLAARVRPERSSVGV